MAFDESRDNERPKNPICKFCQTRFILLQGLYQCKCGKFDFYEILKRKQDVRDEEKK